jgi:hypothetical protein
VKPGISLAAVVIGRSCKYKVQGSRLVDGETGYQTTIVDGWSGRDYLYLRVRKGRFSGVEGAEFFKGAWWVSTTPSQRERESWQIWFQKSSGQGDVGFDSPFNLIRLWTSPCNTPNAPEVSPERHEACRTSEEQMGRSQRLGRFASEQATSSPCLESCVLLET